MARTRRDQYVEQVAGILVGWWGGPDEARARTINAEYGWTADMRLVGEEYVSDTDYTRVSDLRLSAAELERALALADRWLAGDYGMEA